MYQRHLIHPQAHFYSLWNETHLWFACPVNRQRHEGALVSDSLPAAKDSPAEKWTQLPSWLWHIFLGFVPHWHVRQAAKGCFEQRCCNWKLLTMEEMYSWLRIGIFINMWQFPVIVSLSRWQVCFRSHPGDTHTPTYARPDTERPIGSCCLGSLGPSGAWGSPRLWAWNLCRSD